MMAWPKLEITLTVISADAINFSQIPFEQSFLDDHWVNEMQLMRRLTVAKRMIDCNSIVQLSLLAGE